MSSSVTRSQAQLAPGTVERSGFLSLNDVDGFRVAQQNNLPEPDDQPADKKTEKNSDDEQQAVSCYIAPSISEIQASISFPAGKLPESAYARCAEQTLTAGDMRIAGGWAVTEYRWAATCMRHRPLYFEEVNAERYGYTPSYLLQPLVSAGRFFATIPALPYKMAVDCPCDCVYTLGHYRPGSCNPRRPHRWPIQLGASMVEVGAIAGLILLLP
ncbi:MAG: hypothetical protein MK171_01850 [Pirellulales bacterium]|nr:hypothetical protein [Pirellulales bacterium]